MSLIDQNNISVTEDIPEVDQVYTFPDQVLGEEPIDLKNLVSDPKKLKTYKTHFSPKEAFDKLVQGEKNTTLEKIVSKDPRLAHYYALNVLKSPFTLGEPTIATDALYSYVYAMDVLKGPFPLGEKSIFDSPYRHHYAKEVLQDRPWTGLDQKVDEAMDLKKLVTDPKKLKTYDTHISPDEAYARLKKGDKDPILVKVVAKDPKYAYYYAKYVLEGPFPLGEPIIAKDPNYAYYYAVDILKGPFPLGEPEIAKDPGYAHHYAEYVLKGRPWTELKKKTTESMDLKNLVSDPSKISSFDTHRSPKDAYTNLSAGNISDIDIKIVSKDPEFAFLYAALVLKGPFPLGEPAISKNGWYAARYASVILNKPWPLAEPVIYNSPWWFYYEREVLNGLPWTNITQPVTEALDLKNLVTHPKKLKTYKTHISPEEAYTRLANGEKEPYLEQVVAKDAACSYDYAIYVLKGPFPLGEPTIAKDAEYSYLYALFVLKGTFPLGEPVIARDPNYSFDYARFVLKGPFPLGEPALYNSKLLNYSYERQVLRGRPWTGLDQKVDEAMDLKNLVSDPTKLKTYKTHISPQDAYHKLLKGDKDPVLVRAVAKSPRYAYLYAREISTVPFPLGEPVIAKDAIYAVRYAKDILTGAFPLGEPAIARYAGPSFWYANEVLKGPFPLGEPAIYRDSNYKSGYEIAVLKGSPWTGLDQKVDEAMDLKNLVDDPTKLKTYNTHISPKEAFYRLLKGDKDPILVKVVAKFPRYAYLYAREISTVPFPLGEPVIAKHPMYAYYYANEVLKDPFPLGEPAIAKDPELAYDYARDVLKVKGPFKLGEPAIATDPQYAYFYAINVLKGPFPLGEPTIAKFPEYAYLYAREVLKGPFKLGEPAIATDDYWKQRYQEQVLKGRPWTGLDQKVDEAIDLKKLVTDPTKLKTYDTHLNAVETVKYKIENGVAPTQEDLTKVYNETKKQRGPNIWLSQQDKILNFNDILKYGRFSYLFAKNILNGPFPLGEKAIATSPSAAASYAANVLQDRFPLGEPKILTSPYWAYFYAEEVIKGPWPIAEPIIAEDGYYALEYSKYVLNAPFPMAENVIYDNKYTRMEYETLWGSEWKGIEGDLPDDDDDPDLFTMTEAIDLKNLVDDPTKLKTYDTHISPKEAFYRLLKGDKDPILVKAVAKSPEYSYLYAIDVLKGPFPLGEPAIAKTASRAYSYAIEVLKGPFPLGEPIIAKDPEYAYFYAKYVLNDRFEMGEPAILRHRNMSKYKTFVRSLPDKS